MKRFAVFILGILIVSFTPSVCTGGFVDPGAGGSGSSGGGNELVGTTWKYESSDYPLTLTLEFTSSTSGTFTTIISNSETLTTLPYTYSNGSGTIGGKPFTVSGDTLTYDSNSYEKQ